ncbi:serine hydrolase domain-containing protein [Spirillospora sp. CA-294931]|uniref:serine hydrolase domain-containing protein n=1 Tax=Spirillospora sp. CA-294931 TaxID=3240042 RepID=UPI003D92D05F
MSVQKAIDELVASGAERGIQVAVYRDGVQVVDAVAGLADPATGRSVTPGTVFYNYSIGKAATATVVHVLAERGVFTYDTPVADLWPEFAAHGKQGVTIRHVLNHTAGVPGIPLDTTLENLCDPRHMCDAIAASELWWEPGTKIGYHAYTFGYILAEVMRRATGKTMSQVLAEEVTGPLGIADELYLAMPESEHHRLAVLEDAESSGGMSLDDLPPDLPMFKAGPMTTMPNAEFGNRTDILAAEIPAGAKTTARAMARLYAALLGEVDGVRLISPDRLREISALSATGTDQVFGNEATAALGYFIGFPGVPVLDVPTLFGVGGAGGSFACADTATGISFAITKNRVSSDFDTTTALSPLIIEAAK